MEVQRARTSQGALEGAEEREAGGDEITPSRYQDIIQATWPSPGMRGSERHGDRTLKGIPDLRAWGPREGSWTCPWEREVEADVGETR